MEQEFAVSLNWKPARSSMFWWDNKVFRQLTRLEVAEEASSTWGPLMLILLLPPAEAEAEEKTVMAWMQRLQVTAPSDGKVTTETEALGRVREEPPETVDSEPLNQITARLAERAGCRTDRTGRIPEALLTWPIPVAMLPDTVESAVTTERAIHPMAVLAAEGPVEPRVLQAEEAEAVTPEVERARAAVVPAEEEEAADPTTRERTKTTLRERTRVMVGC